MIFDNADAFQAFSMPAHYSPRHISHTLRKPAYGFVVLSSRLAATPSSQLPASHSLPENTTQIRHYAASYIFAMPYDTVATTYYMFKIIPRLIHCDNNYLMYGLSQRFLAGTAECPHK